MSFESDLFAMLKAAPAVFAIVSDNIFPIVADLVDGPAVPPYVVFERVGGASATLQGSTGPQEIQCEIHAFGTSGDQLETLAQAIKTCIEQSAGAVRGAVDNETDAFEDAEQLYVRTIAATFFHPAN